MKLVRLIPVGICLAIIAFGCLLAAEAPASDASWEMTHKGAVSITVSIPTPTVSATTK